MKKNFWKKPYGAIALIMALVLGFAVNPSLAYFTDYTTAAGTAPVALEPSHTEIIEILNGLDKHKTVMGTKEELIVLYPTKTDIIAKILFFQEEIQPAPTINKVSVDKNELEMAKTLINSMTDKFAPEAYHDEYQAKLHDAIQTTDISLKSVQLTGLNLNIWLMMISFSADISKKTTI